MGEEKKPSSETVSVTIKLPRELRDESRRLLTDRDMSLSQVVRKCLREFVKTEDN